jgi:hypothetical protein
MIGTGGTAPKIVNTHTVALYHPADGRILHLHQVVTFEGGKSISAEAAQREAHEIARRHGHDVGSLGTLLITGKAPTAHQGRFRVDHATQKLVSEPPPQRIRARPR